PPKSSDKYRRIWNLHVSTKLPALPFDTGFPSNAALWSLVKYFKDLICNNRVIFSGPNHYCLAGADWTVIARALEKRSTTPQLPALVIFPRVAIRHSKLYRVNFGEGPECVQERHETDRHWDEFGDIRGKAPPPNPTAGRGRSAELAHSVRASVPSLRIIVRPQPSIQGSAWFLSCLWHRWYRA